MIRDLTCRPGVLGFLILSAALALGACDNDVNVTGPDLPDPFLPNSSANQTVMFFGSVTATEGACFEATLLLDGVELPGARAVCRASAGCTRLDLDAGPIERVSGHHTVAFQVLRQSRPAVEYLAQGRMLVEVLGGPVLSQPLGPRRATLEAGQSVTFSFDFLP